MPFGAAHHQKLVVVDDAVAFAGGLDLTIRRWDTPAHRPHDRRRVDPQGRPYPPFHDMQMVVDGAAAAALAELARARWARAACEELPAVGPVHPAPWPEGVAPDLRAVAVGIARTEPAFRGADEIREVEALFADSIARAERCIYIESQFLTAHIVAEALIARLHERAALEVVIVGPRTHHTWLEHRTMLAGRIRFMQAIRAAGLADRVRLLHPVVRGRLGEAAVMVHAKAMVVDDRLLRIGSANLSNRSMGTDTECDLAIEAHGAEQRAGIARLRNRMLGEHLGLGAEAVAAELARHGSLFALLDAHAEGARTLRPIADGRLPREPVSGIEAAADPHRPMQVSEYLADIGEGAPPRNPLPTLVRIALVVVPIVLLGLAWHYTPLADLLQPRAIQAALHASGSWAPAAAIGLFLLLGFLAFPLNVLIVATAAAFGLWPGLLYAAAGALLSAAATYAAGRWIGPGVLRNLLGPRINRISSQVGRQGILAVTAVRLMPVAPFGLVNLVAGAMRIRVLDYMAGTALGLLPGILLMSALGGRVFHILAHPSALNLLALGGALVLCAGVSWGLQKLVSRARHEG